MNNFRSPTYWGSLIALLATLVMLVWTSATSAPPEYVSGIASEPAVSNAIFYCSIGLVAICTIRYYLAITLNLYGGAGGDSFEKLRPSVRKFVFVLLFLLYFLSTSSVGAVSVIGLKSAMLSCLFMAAISGMCVLICWTASEENRRRHAPTRLSLGGFDLIFFVAAVIYIWQLSTSPNAVSAQWLSAIAFFLTFIAFHELVGIYRHEVRQLFIELVDFMKS